jgi:rubrerythrin
MSPRTKQNLLNAMKCEAFESATYSRFAAHARMESDWDLAKAFQDDADGNRTRHFAKEAALEGLVAQTPENLRNAIDAETDECKTYTQFALEAKQDGDLTVANEFEEICRDKTNRCARLEGLLADMGVHSHIRTIEA